MQTSQNGLISLLMVFIAITALFMTLHLQYTILEQLEMLISMCYDTIVETLDEMSDSLRASMMKQ